MHVHRTTAEHTRRSKHVFHDVILNLRLQDMFTNRFHELEFVEKLLRCPNLPNFQHVFPMAVARSVLLWRRCDCYVLPILPTTSRLHIRGQIVSILSQRMTSLRCRAQANVSAALYWLRRVPVDSGR